MTTEARRDFLRFATANEATWNANFRDLNAAVTRMATLAPSSRIAVEEVREEVERLYIFSAVLIVHVFVDKKRRALSLGETWLVATLCLAWALVLNYELLREILFVAETVGPFGPAGAFGMALGLHLLMLHVAFGVVGTRYARWRCGRLADSSAD